MDGRRIKIGDYVFIRREDIDPWDRWLVLDINSAYCVCVRNARLNRNMWIDAARCQIVLLQSEIDAMPQGKRERSIAGRMLMNKAHIAYDALVASTEPDKIIAHVWLNGLHRIMAVAVDELETLIGLVGWTVCNDLQHLTAAGRAELNRLESLALVGGDFESVAAIKDWMDAHTISKTSALTPDI